MKMFSSYPLLSKMAVSTPNLSVEDDSVNSQRTLESESSSIVDQSMSSSDSESLAGEVVPDDEVLVIQERKIVKKTKRRRREDKKQEIMSWFLNTNTSVLYQDRVDGKLVPRMVIPHVMKDDIRLRYPTMITNIYNSCDMALTNNYINQYYRPDFIAVQQLYGSFPSKLKGRMEIHGLQYFGQYWFERQNDFPDVMFSIKDFHVDVLSDDTGVIRCKFHLSGTQLLPVQEPDINGTGVIPSEDPEEPPVIIIGSRPMDLFANPIDYEDGIKSRLLFNNANMDIDKGCDEVFAEYVASRKLDSDNDEEEQHDESTLAGVLPSGYEELKTFSSHLFSEKHKTINEDDVDNDSNLSSKYRKLCSINGENPNDLQPFDNEEKNSEPTHLVKLNTPASNAITMMKVGFDGIVSLHFDADSRIFLTEFYLFGAEDGEPSTPSE